MLHTDEHAHGNKGTYNMVFVGLAILTVLEVAVAEVLGGGAFRGAVLLGLTSAKAFFVAAYYMHLKYDPPILTWIFVVPMIIAVAVIISLQGLAGY